MKIEIAKAAEGRLAHRIRIGSHELLTDVASAQGGDDLGPDPHELLDSALGACTALTVMLVARRKQWPLEDVQVEITHVEADGLYTLTRQVRFVGALDAAQREYLLGIANKCPIHKALHGRFEVRTSLVD